MEKREEPGGIAASDQHLKSGYKALRVSQGRNQDLWVEQVLVPVAIAINSGEFSR
jgi:hypothetical protein